MPKLTNDGNNQTYIHYQLTIHNSHDSEDDFPLRLSKRQSLPTTTVLFRTILTWTITPNRLLILQGSNHLQFQYYCNTDPTIAVIFLGVKVY